MRLTNNKRSIVLGAALGLLLAPAPVPALAGTLEAFGPNSDFPDINLVMPFAAKGSRVGFFSISNLGVSGPNDTPVPVTWNFYDESGEQLISVQRYILGEGGTDVVNIAEVRSRAADGTEGPSTSFVGRNGFVVVSKDDGEPDLIGNWTIANTATNSGFGANGAGLGFVGLLDEIAFLFGTSFAPATLEDSLLVVLGIDDSGAVPTSLTQGNSPAPGEVVFSARIALHRGRLNPPEDAPGGVVGCVDVPVEGSALFTTLPELFPDADLSSSVTVVIDTTERPQALPCPDPEAPIPDGVPSLGFYGQAVGQFGAAQSLRTALPLQ